MTEGTTRLRAITLAITLLLAGVHVLDAQSRDLHYYLNTGETNSPLLKDYANQLLTAKVDSAKVLAELKPQVNALSQVLIAPTAHNFGYDSSLTNGGNYSALVGATLPFLNRRIRQGRFGAIAVRNQGVRANAAISVLELKQRITDQYILTYADQRQVAFSRTLFDLLDREGQALEQLVAKGVYMQTDLLTLRVNKRAQSIAIEQATAFYRRDLYALDQLCGITDTVSATLTDPGLVVPPAFDLGKSPVWQQFLIDSLANESDKLLVDLNYRPRLSSFADAGFMSSSFRKVPDHFGTSFGLNFAMPIYDGKQRKLEHDRIALREETRKNYKDFYTLQFRQHAAQLRESLLRSNKLLADLQDQLAQEDKLIALFQIEIEKGIARITDLFLVLANHAATQNALILAETDQHRIINEMNYLK